jgi:predicted ferric reductase
MKKLGSLTGGLLMLLKLRKNIMSASRKQSPALYAQSGTNLHSCRIVVLTLSVGIPLLAGLWLWMTALLPTDLRQDGLLLWLQSSFTLPALVGKRHSAPLPFKLGYMPDRPMSILLTIYTILNVVFCCAPYRSVQPSSWFSNRSQELAAYVANRTGVLSFANMALAILFSTRNNPLMYLSGWSQTTFLAFHRWAARMAILQAVVHSIVYTADYMYYQPEGNTYSAQAVQPYWWWGIIATIAMSLMAGLSAFIVRQYAYEAFLVGHIVLAILSLVGCWYHIDLRFGKNWGYEVWLYIAFAFWSFDRLTRFVKVGYYNFISRTSATAETIAGTNILVLTVSPGKSWTGGPGQHTFLYFPGMKRFWENHPFTIMDWSSSSNSAKIVNTDSETNSAAPSTHEAQGKEVLQTTQSVAGSSSSNSSANDRIYIRCMLRAHRGATNTLRDSLLGASGVATIPALTEGPYGHLSPPTRAILGHADKVICIAGGIGITYAAGFAKQFALERMAKTPASSQLFRHCRTFTLVWSVREQALLDYVRNNVLHDPERSGGLDDGSLRYRFWLTGRDSAVSTEQARWERTDKLVTAYSSTSRNSDDGREHPQQQGDEITILSDGKKMSRVTAEQDRLLTLQSGHRMDVGDVVRFETTVGPDDRVAVLVCGPGGFADEVRFHVAAVARRGGLVDLVEETFAW